VLHGRNLSPSLTTNRPTAINSRTKRKSFAVRYENEIINSEHAAMCCQSEISLEVRRHQIIVTDSAFNTLRGANRHTGNFVKRPRFIFRKAVYLRETFYIKYSELL
jgi:hypothetical protein